MSKLRRKDAAKYLGLSPRTLEKLATTGGGPPFYKLGTAVIYDTDDLDTWLGGKRRLSTSDAGEIIHV